jgi:hypothetical protein
MRKILVSFFAAVVVAITGINISFAQDGAPPNFTPVEMQACSFKDRKDSGDFDDAMTKMVKWMDDNNSEPYASWVLEKMYTGPDREFDFLYVGAWPNGSTMGKDITEYRATASAEIEAFADVADCPASLLYASMTIKDPPEGDLARDGVVITMSDCKVADGRKVIDAVAAMRAYGDYRTENGSPGGTWLWFQVYGGADGDINFKLINSHTNVQALGNAFQWGVENAAYRKSGALMEGLVDCDVPRAYDADSVVNTFPTDND